MNRKLKNSLRNLGILAGIVIFFAFKSIREFYWTPIWEFFNLTATDPKVEQYGLGIWIIAAVFSVWAVLVIIIAGIPVRLTAGKSKLVTIFWLALVILISSPFVLSFTNWLVSLI